VERELHEVMGGLDLLDTLREEIAQWLEEAQDESKKEALENVLGHLEVMETEYRTRQEGLQKKLDAA
jgi:hypothetical protein